MITSIKLLNINLDNLLKLLTKHLNLKKYYQVILVVITNDTNDYYCEMMKNFWIPFINYIKKHKLSIKVFLLFGQKLKNIQINSDDIIIANTGEGYVPQILKKTIFALEYIYKNYNFKHLIRTNLSSFFISNKLLELSNGFSDNKVYVGASGYPNKNLFVTGSCIWLSKDTVLYLINNKNKLQYSIPDDVAIGKILTNIFFKPLIKILNIVKKEDYTLLHTNNSNIIKNYNTYHIRIKSNNRYNDAKLVKLFFQYYYE